MTSEILEFDGSISGARFASGDTIVVGSWWVSPFGRFADVMWARPDGRRVLLAGDDRVLGFVGVHYRFDERVLVDVRVHESSTHLHASAGPLSFEMVFGDRRDLASRLLGIRPERLRRWRPWIALEDTIFRPLLAPVLGSTRSVRARGRTAAGMREWYAVHDFRTAEEARASVDGTDLGPATREIAPAGFGFSELPSRPGRTRVTSLIEAEDHAAVSGASR